MNLIYRKIALKLSRLNRSDQKWILTRLAYGQRKLIEKNLKVIRRNNWKPSGLIEEYSSTTVSGAEFKPSGGAVYKLLNRQNAETIFKLIEREPDWVVCILIAGNKWTWIGKLLQLMGPERAENVSSMIIKESESIGPVLKNAVVETIANKVSRNSEPINNEFEQHLARENGLNSRSGISA